MVLVALALLRAAAGADAAPRDLQAHGTDERLWLALTERLPGKDAGEMTTLLVREKNEVAWKRLEPISARVLSMGSRGSQLAVLLPRGDWRLTTESGFATGRPLPDRAQLVALGSGGGTLWGVGVAPSVRPSTRATTTTAPSSSQPAKTRPAPETATMAATPAADAGELVLYRLDPDGWKEQRELPDGIKPGEGVMLSLGEAGGTPILAHKTSATSVRVYRFVDGKSWQIVADVELMSDIADFKLLGGTGAPVLWLRPVTGPARLWLANPGGDPIVRALGVPPEFEQSVAHANGAIRVLWIDRTESGGPGKIFDQRLNSSTGAPEGDPVPAALPGPSIERAVLFWGQLVLTTAVLIALMASARRRREAQDLALDPEKLRLAPFSTRFTAGIIDAIPLLVAGWMVFARNDPNMTQLQAVTTVLIGVAAYIALTTLVEVLAGRTIGKLLTGLRVVGLDGKPAGVGARLMRNALRIIDLPAFPLALILFSPLRQRAGDLAAGTLVVSGKTKEKREPVAGNERQQDDGS